MARYDWISFTSDFGQTDGFVASCRGVIARIAPDVKMIDVTHDVSPGDIRRGAAVLAQTVVHLPTAVHLAVVDPGVGTARRAVALRTDHGLLVGPDNGLLLGAAEALGGVTAAVELTETAWFAPSVSPTFHGRDVFAPVAARLALGEDLAAAGRILEAQSLVRLPEPVVVAGTGWLESEVRGVDRFGNIQLAARPSALAGVGDRLMVAGMRAVRTSTFGDAPPGALVVFTDSSGYVAVGVNGGRAVVALSVGAGDIVRVTDAP